METQAYKVTLYMTPDQWDEFSKWSVGKESMWLHMFHESDKLVEENKKLKETVMQFRSGLGVTCLHAS